jgi:hypothetical protein
LASVTINEGTFINSILVCSILLLPGMIEYANAMSVQDGSYDLWYTSKSSVGGFSLMFWSLFLCSSYLTHKLCRFLVAIFPVILTQIVRWIVGAMPRTFDIYMGYITDLQPFISSAVFLIVFVIAFFFVFRPDLNNTDVKVCINV